MKPTFRLSALSALLASASILAGCNLLPEAQADRARFYVLDASAATESAPAGAPRLGLRPVEVPAYLKNKAIATRVGESEVRYASDAFWAEPLEASLARIVRERLSSRAAVVPYPFPAQLGRDYDITVRVLRADGTTSGVSFSAVIEITRVGDAPELVARREFTAPSSAWNGDYGQLARALSVAAGALADEIAATLPKK